MAETGISLQLPSIPKDCYYEDYVAAILNAGGYYLDRSVHRTEDGLDLLELDVVATKFEVDHYRNTIVEVKSGGWGIKDLFKVNGWLTYLSHEHAAFIYQTSSSDGKDEATIQNVARELKIELLSNPVLADGNIDDTAILQSFGIDLVKVPKYVIRTLRYSYDLERVMLDYIHAYAKENEGYQTPNRVYHYFRKLDESFFIKDSLERLRFLSDLAMEHKNIACILDNELKGKGVLQPEQCTKFDNLYEIENPNVMQCRPVDVALYVQLLNRLLVLKGITEYILTPKTPANSWFEELLADMSYNAQNSNITQAIEELKKHPHNYLYPYFFQIFFYVYGGFFMVARKNEEYNVLSNITGVPVNEIDNALRFWDVLFPTSSSWMTTMNHGGLYYMRFVPSPLRGLGVNYRRHYYASDELKDSEEQFENLKKLTTEHCYNDMAHWNNSAYIMLSQDQHLHQCAGMDGKFERHVKAAEDYIKRKTIYTKVERLTDKAVEYNCRNFNLQGFICYITPDLYDLYVVKPKNNLISFPINQVVVELNLNQGQMRNCFVMGTDEHFKKSDDDTIWFTGTVQHTTLEQLNSVVDEINKLN